MSDLVCDWVSISTSFDSTSFELRRVFSALRITYQSPEDLAFVSCQLSSDNARCAFGLVCIHYIQHNAHMPNVSLLILCLSSCRQSTVYRWLSLASMYRFMLLLFIGVDNLESRLSLLAYSLTHAFI